MRLASFAWNHEGLGHVSRTIAIHDSMRRRYGASSIFFVEHPQELIRDYNFAQVVLPSIADAFLGDRCSDPTDVPDVDVLEVARSIVERCMERVTLVLHDVVIHRLVYEAASRRDVPQVVVHRRRKNDQDFAARIRRHAPAVRAAFLIEGEDVEDVRFGLWVQRVPAVVRAPVASRPIWSSGDPKPHVLITAGGGGHQDAHHFVREASLAARQFCIDVAGRGTVMIVPGPFSRCRVDVEPTAGVRTVVLSAVSGLQNPYDATDYVICQGGYNTIAEVAANGVPAVAVPGVRVLDDQVGRIRETAVTTPTLRIANASASDILRALRDVSLNERASTRRATPEPVPSGADVIAHALAVMVGADTAPRRDEYQTCNVEFLGRQFFVDQRVLVPRRKSELTAKVAVECLRRALASRKWPQVVDVGTGCGAIVMSLALECGPEARYLAVDISEGALHVAAVNASRLNVPHVEFRYSDLLSNVPERLDVVVANLPYLPRGVELPLQTRSEPPEAVYDEADGTCLVHRLFMELKLRRELPSAVVIETSPDLADHVGHLGQECLGARGMCPRIYDDDAGPRVVVLER